MKNLFTALIISVLCVETFAQTKPYHVAFSGQGKKVQVLIQQASVNIQGYDGNEVVIEQGENRKELPKEAEGLRLVTAGVVDNTGVGANAEVEGNILKISIPKNRYLGTLTIKIPKNMNLGVSEGQNWGEQKIIISDISGEIELKTNNSKAYLNDITGPLVAHTGNGKIFIVYSKINQNSPSSINASGAIDLTLPADSKANLKIRSYYGDLFTDWDITAVKKESKTVASSGIKTTLEGKVVASSPDAASTIAAKIAKEDAFGDDDRFNYKVDSFGGIAGKSDNFEGTINGGGVVIDLKSSNGNIYVRKKK